MFRYGLVLFLVIFGAESKVLFRLNGLPELGLPSERSGFQTVAINVGHVTQKIDNSANGGATWENRYFETTTFFKPSGPIFVMLPGEMNAASYLGYLNYGLMAKIANDSGAYVALLEHRYYGDSIPNDLSTENLKYLTEEQALSDAINFIKTQKSKPEYGNSKVVIFGGSYGGVLAARMRIEHPELVNAAVSSSAPLQPVVAFTAYLEKFQTSLNNNTCAQVMTKSFTRLHVMFDEPEKHAKLEKDFRFCQPIDATNSSLDRMAFLEQLIVILSSQVQYGYPQKIKDFCSLMCLPTSLDDYSRLVNFVNNYMHQQRMECLALYSDYISAVNSLQANNLMRPWLYQQCSQIGDLITTGSPNQPFLDSIPMTWWENVCSAAFDIKNVGGSLKASTDALVKSYGGSTPDARFTKIVSTQGSLDPWSTLGLQSSPGPDAPLFVIQGVAHCMDLAPDTEFDPEPLKTARANVHDIVLKWLS